jgi:aconitate hydratase
VTSPETVIALALSGRVDFDPIHDTLTNDQGEEVQLHVEPGIELPSAGFESGEAGFIAPPAERSDVEVVVSPTSDRLQLLEPFAAWDGNDFIDLPVLVKAKGKCTTDHISAAGKWLRFRGHLENISGNLFLGAINAFTDAAGEGKDQLDGTTKTFPEIAKHYSEAGQPWVAIGDENYGEGSSREHAAMEPRFRGARAVISRSFARIAETNLKKQGVLPLTFADPASYDAIGEDDRISVLGLADLAPDRPVQCRITKPDGSTVDFTCNQTLSPEQIEWFTAGGALNIIRQKNKG